MTGLGQSLLAGGTVRFFAAAWRVRQVSGPTGG